MSLYLLSRSHPDDVSAIRKYLILWYDNWIILVFQFSGGDKKRWGEIAESDLLSLLLPIFFGLCKHMTFRLFVGYVVIKILFYLILHLNIHVENWMARPLNVLVAFSNSSRVLEVSGVVRVRKADLYWCNVSQPFLPVHKVATKLNNRLCRTLWDQWSYKFI